MEWIFVVIGILSFLYGGTVLFYTGLTSFLWFWPLFGLVNFTMLVFARSIRRKRMSKQEIHLFPYVFVFTSYAAGVAVLCALMVAVFSRSFAAPQENLDYVIVMGAELDADGVSVSLEKRLDTAVAYHRENPNTVFVLSGGKREYEKNTEATVMYNYMVRHGVPAKNLVMEFYSTSTLEQVRFSQLAIQEDVAAKTTREAAGFRKPGTNSIMAPVRPPSVGILTGDYNLYRAMKMAKKYGFEEVYPIATQTDRVLFIHLCVREAAAIFKDMLIGNM